MSGSDPFASRTPRVRRDDETIVPDLAADVVAWIGDDVDRAEEARAVELARDKPRKTVLDTIDRVLGG